MNIQTSHVTTISSHIRSTSSRIRIESGHVRYIYPLRIYNVNLGGGIRTMHVAILGEKRSYLEPTPFVELFIYFSI